MLNIYINGYKLLIVGMHYVDHQNPEFIEHIQPQYLYNKSLDNEQFDFSSIRF